MSQVKIVIVGTGYVGLVSGVCFAAIGHDVTCVDTNVSKITKLREGVSPIYEPGLDALIAENVAAGRLHFSTDLVSALPGCEAVFIAVGTPTAADGISADLHFVYAVAEQIAPHLHSPVTVVTKSTVPVMTNHTIETRIHEINPKAQFDICSNPEFLREGCAIEDFMHPDRIVVGVRSDRARDTMTRIYAPLMQKGATLLWTSPESAELIKYASNALLATKVAFINEVADLAEKTGGTITDIAKGVGLDSRIGAKFLQAGPGYGGSCFPKDTRAFAQMARLNNVPSHIVESVISSNNHRKQSMAQRVVAALGGSVEGKKIAILGTTFKANTDDMRESVALDLLPQLLELRARVHAYDPTAEHQAYDQLPRQVQWHDSPASCYKDADALILLTDWPEFHTINLTDAAKQMKGRVLIDLRNFFDPSSATAAGLDYYPIGSAPRKAKS